MKDNSLKINLNQFKKELLEGMILAAERIQEMADIKGKIGISAYFEYVPLSFKPSQGDKLQFKNMIKELLPVLVEDYCRGDINATLVGIQIFTKRYYPWYGPYIEREFKMEFGEEYNSKVNSSKKL